MGSWLFSKPTNIDRFGRRSVSSLWARPNSCRSPRSGSTASSSSVCACLWRKLGGRLPLMFTCCCRKPGEVVVHAVLKHLARPVFAGGVCFRIDIVSKVDTFLVGPDQDQICTHPSPAVSIRSMFILNEPFPGKRTLGQGMTVQDVALGAAQFRYPGLSCSVATGFNCP